MVIAASRRADFSELAIIDIGALGKGDAAAEARTVAALRVACEEVGFFYISNHGVSQDLIDNLFDQSRRFFAQPFARRNEINVTKSPCYRGYLPPDAIGENLKHANRIQDSFNMALDLGPDDPYVKGGIPLYGANAWPADMPGFRETLSAYYDNMQILMMRLLGGFAMALDLPRDFFDAQYTKPLTQCRLLHYPPQKPEEIVERIGVRPHADSGAFTILLQEDVEGLEILSKGGEWVVAPPMRGTFVVNIANLIMRLSNNRFTSTLHRVINRSGRDRLSVPFFASPNYETVVETLPQFIDADNPPQFPPLHVGEYTAEWYRGSWPSYNKAA